MKDKYQRKGYKNRILSREQLLQAHEYALRVMEEVGCKVDCEEALHILGELGCDIKDQGRVKIPP